MTRPMSNEYELKALRAELQANQSEMFQLRGALVGLTTVAVELVEVVRRATEVPIGRIPEQSEISAELIAKMNEARAPKAVDLYDRFFGPQTKESIDWAELTALDSDELRALQARIVRVARGEQP